MSTTTETAPKFRADRFRKLIAANEKLPKGRTFNMATYAMRTKCGTAACAAGNYVLAHPRCGLSLKWGPLRRGSQDAYLNGPPGTLGGFWSLADHFRIGVDESIRLFGGARERRLSVLRRLRAFLAERTAKRSKR